MRVPKVQVETELLGVLEAEGRPLTASELSVATGVDIARIQLVLREGLQRSPAIPVRVFRSGGVRTAMSYQWVGDALGLDGVDPLAYFEGGSPGTGAEGLSVPQITRSEADE